MCKANESEIKSHFLFDAAVTSTEVPCRNWIFYGFSGFYLISDCANGLKTKIKKDKACGVETRNGSDQVHTLNTNGGCMNRILFLDNLRYLMVSLVVVLHSAMSYSNFAPWWCVKDSSSVFFDIVLLGLDSFLMPVLYFIAGYFTLLSFQKKNIRLFLKGKARRLGLPVVIGIPLISPCFSYLYHYTRKSVFSGQTYREYWTGYMKQAGEFHVGVITSVDQFSHSHLWFMSLLLCFFLIFVGVAYTQKWHQASGPITSLKNTSGKSILMVLIAVGIFSTVSIFFAKMMFASPENPQPWFSIGPLLLFQPERLVTYLLYFSTGVLAYYKKWFVNVTVPGLTSAWILFSLILFTGLLVVLKPLMQNFSGNMLFVFILLRSFFCVSLLAVFTKLAARQWNRASRINELLALNSYHIYIVHFLVVIFLQLSLVGWLEGPAFIKFGIVSAASIVISYGFSHYAIRPYPRRSVAGLYAVFILIMILSKPLGF